VTVEQGIGSFRDIEARIAGRERASIVRTAVVSLAIVAVAGVFLWFAVRELNEVTAELEAARVDLSRVEAARDEAEAALAGLRTQADGARQEAAAARRESEALRAELATVQAQLRESAVFVRHVYQLDWRVAKEIAARSNGAAELLQRIEYLSGDSSIRWNTANEPGKGFNSPGFAGYVLQQMGVLPQDLPPAQALERLPLVDEPPELGDVVVYDGGFAMFWFEDPRGGAFVIGMTVMGIVALEPEFGPRRLGVRHTGLAAR
jgi:cell wall-associated NlpC family hydrolase